jgi:alpha-L-fucosidase 2
MQTTPEKIIHWLGSAVVLCLSIVPLAAAAPAVGTASAAAASDPSATLLWYQQPAVKWEEALPVGNGRLGAMVFGGTSEERLQLNESTLWGGLPHDYSNPEAGQRLAELRRLIFEGKIREAEKLGQTMLGRPLCQRPYQPLGDLRLRFPGHEKVEQYVRNLDLDQAVATTAYRIGGVEFKREVFVSVPDQALVIHLSSSKPGQITFETALDTPHPGIQTQVMGKDTLCLRGQIPPRPSGENWSTGWSEAGLKFEAQLRIAIEGSRGATDRPTDRRVFQVRRSGTGSAALPVQALPASGFFAAGVPASQSAGHLEPGTLAVME